MINVTLCRTKGELCELLLKGETYDTALPQGTVPAEGHLLVRNTVREGERIW